ncbi:leucine-rich repeat domain-containing protein [Cytophagaceae bacterium BD1B2-1]|uniref:Leucine-rich repeat domain-containing protein n=2 Tax=Xanthocytophaga agilis TaxID=3048010 RepID=A0AAE3RDN6_9BACT|nr:leucine-rich repeat domain-containing protein [Xanthocytophaga agilis]
MKTNYMRDFYSTTSDTIRLLNRQIFAALCVMILFLASAQTVFAQTVPIPDANFRQYLHDKFPHTLTSSGELIVAEAAAIDTIFCYNRQISNLAGIQYFTGLNFLGCGGNQLTSLPDLSPLTNLKSLDFSRNQFTVFPTLSQNTALIEVNCSANQISSLPDLSSLPKLVFLRFGKNKFTSFPAFSLPVKSRLALIQCDSNQLTVLPDLSDFKNLVTLDVSYNQLTQLPSLAALTQLDVLQCHGNQLTSLPDLSHNLVLWGIDFSQNQFTEFPDISANTKLGFISCGGNQLDSLPDLTNYPDMQYLRLAHNKFTSLPDISHLNMEQLFVQGNQLTFDDLLTLVPTREKLLKKGNGTNRFYSYNQGEIGTTKTVKLKQGDAYTIDLDIDDTVTTSTYHWYKNAVLVATTQTNKLVFSSLTLGNAGVYTAKVTNPAYPNDTLTNNPVTIEIESNGPWTPVIGGGENHLIILPATLTSSIEGSPLSVGDYIGVFFTDNAGNKVNGGMVKWTGDNQVLNVWGTTATPKNGFTTGESFVLKVWRASDQKEIEVVATYTTTSPYTHAGSYAANGLSSISALHTVAPCVQQVISLHKGWNLISLNVQPADTTMKTIFGSIQNILVKDAAGKILYAPQNGISNGSWNILEGYKVLVTQEEVLTVCGKKIDPQTPISIPYTTYPYFLPYFGSNPVSLTAALGAIENSFNFVQSNEYPAGSANVVAYNYLPSHIINPPIDQIGTLKPGLAYKVSMNKAIPDFRYPSLAGMRTGASAAREKSTSHYDLPVTTTANNALLVLPNEILGKVLVAGDEVAVYTTEGTLAGAGQYTGENLIVTIWENEKMQANTPFNLKVWKQDRQQEIEVATTYKKGNGVFTSNSIQVTSQVTLLTGDKVNTQLLTLYPNPTRESVQIRTLTEQTGPATVRIYTLMGTKVLEVQKNSLQESTLSVGQLAPGQYLCVIQTGDQQLRSKLLIVK